VSRARWAALVDRTTSGEIHVSDRSPRASRLATPRWLDARLVFGVLLVLVAVVVGARVFASAGRYTSVYVARHALVPGEHLNPDDLSTGQVRFSGEGGSYVAVGSAVPTGYLVTRYVAAGEFVPLAALSAQASTPGASRYVTVPVTPGHLPDDLDHGDLVDVYLTPKVGAGDRVPAPTLVLSAVAVEADDGGSQSLSAGSAVAVVLTVPAGRVSAMVHAVESGTVDLVRVPPSVAAGAPGPVVAVTAPAS
jgi:hypothetical protein